MKHGPHDNCMMCKMAKAIGMMEKYPKDCNCQEKKEKEEHYDEHKATVHEHAHL